MLMALGLGSLFNHNAQPNLDYRVHQPILQVHFYASRDIQKDEELCIFYGGKLWFSDPTQPETCLDLSDDEASFLAGFSPETST